MPELPEVETIRRDLEKVILNKEITNVELRTARCVQGDRIRLLATLIGGRFTKLDRRGKLLVFRVADVDDVLHVHLKMTGQLICQIAGGLIVGGHPAAKIDALPNAYTHVVFTFDDGTVLYFNDVRTFGYVRLADIAAQQAAEAKYGPEPLSAAFDRQQFEEIFSGRKGKLKALLLNQSLVAGIGNIYADEICFRAKVLPQRRFDTLDKNERMRLFRALKSIISEAVDKRGTTFSNFVDAAGKKGGYMPYLKVYGRHGERCKRCATVVKKSVVAGRGTHFCSLCQK